MIAYRFVLRERNLKHHKNYALTLLFFVAKKHLLMFLAYTINQVIGYGYLIEH
jgi:hypothetical protein